jgi:YVTN family beta-propeller protein
VSAIWAAPAFGADPPVAYVTNETSNTVTPIDTATNVAGTAIPVDDSPVAVAITPNGEAAYVANRSSESVTPIDTATNTAGTPIAAGFAPDAIAITPDSKTVYVVNQGGNTVTPIDIATNTAGAAIAVGSDPTGIAISPDGKTAWIADTGAGSITPIHTATNIAGTPIPVGGDPTGIAISSDGGTVWVTNLVSNTVTPIETATDVVGTPIPVGLFPSAVAISPDGKTAFVANTSSDTLTPFATATSTAGTPIAAGDGPRSVAITPDGTSAYVTDENSDTVTPIDTATDTAGTPIIVGTTPNGIAITPDQGPVAAFAATAAPAGEGTSFDGSASRAADGEVASYRWEFGDGAIQTTVGPTTTHIYATPGTYTVTLTVTDQSGCSTTTVFTGQTMSCNGGPSARTTRQLTVTSAPPSPSPGAASTSSPVALRGLRITPARVSTVGRRVGGRCVKEPRHRKHGPACLRPARLTIRYSLSADAPVTFQITGRLPGRKVGRRCVAPRPGNRRRQKCVRTVKALTPIMRQGNAGADRFLLARKLGPGTYTLTATPAAGAPERVTFKIPRLTISSGREAPPTKVTTN